MWVTTLTYDGSITEDTLVDLDEQLELHAGSVAALPGRGFTVTIWSDDQGLAKAASQATELMDCLVTGDMVGVETVTQVEYERRADGPTLPRLVSAPEVAEMLGGISRQRVYQLQQEHALFPEPLFRLRTGPIWDARAVEKFAETWTRQPGRPRKAAM